MWLIGFAMESKLFIYLACLMSSVPLITREPNIIAGYIIFFYSYINVLFTHSIINVFVWNAESIVNNLNCKIIY